MADVTPETVADEARPVPVGPRLMRQRWSHLLFLHWEVPHDALRPLVPPELTIDTFEGRAFVGLVPFTMSGVRARFLPPLPGLSSFEEVNVRTYVRHEGRDPGVWFFSLDAANAVAVWAARATYHLPYHHARMSLEESGGTIRYRSERLRPGPTPAGCSMRYEPAGPEFAAAPGSLEFFLVERYRLYSRSPAGRLHGGEVEHPPYPIQPARLHDLDETLLAAAGIARPDAPPLLHYARTVHPWIHPLRRVRDP